MKSSTGTDELIGGKQEDGRWLGYRDEVSVSRKDQYQATRDISLRLSGQGDFIIAAQSNKCFLYDTTIGNMAQRTRSVQTGPCTSRAVYSEGLGGQRTKKNQLLQATFTSHCKAEACDGFAGRELRCVADPFVKTTNT